MKNANETGHAKNVANFESLITSITALGDSYNPSNEGITLSALQTAFASAKQALLDVHADLTAYTFAVDAREGAFAPFSKKVTRINNALKASTSSAQIDESVQTIFRKLQGKRAGSKLTDEEKQALEAKGKEVNQISVSQLSYDNRLNNFSKLITMLSSVPEYIPNEEDLKLETLQALYDDLNTKNSNVIIANVQLSNIRQKRNEILYKPQTGIVDLASTVKKYLKSAFGAQSPQYKQVSKLVFSAKYLANN